jgi:hypothetical protein
MSDEVKLIIFIIIMIIEAPVTTERENRSFSNPCITFHRKYENTVKLFTSPDALSYGHECSTGKQVSMLACKQASGYFIFCYVIGLHAQTYRRATP